LKLFSKPKLQTKTNAKNANKIELLNLIKRKKSILFGKFSSDLDNREKHSAWEEVLSKAKSLGMLTEDRRADFVRDKLWGVWRSRAMVTNAIF